MPNTFSAFRHLESIGFILSLDAEKGLKIEPKEKITADCRSFIIEHKAEIVARLTDRQFLPVIPVKDPEPAAQTKGRPGHVRPPPVALAWLLDHRQALDDTGWTRAELYRRNKSKPGIVWLKIWDTALLLVYLHDDGVIEFKCRTHGRDFIQTARPASFWTRPIDNSLPNGMGSTELIR